MRKPRKQARPESPETRAISELYEEVFRAYVQYHPFRERRCYFIRTVTYHLVGRVKEVLRDFLVLEDASWVADSGRFMQAIRDGILSEVEPVGTAFVSLGSIADAFPWPHPLPSKQK